MSAFIVVDLTPADSAAIERRAEHVQLKSPTFDRDSQEWVELHDPAAGFVPDRPANARSPVTLAG